MSRAASGWWKRRTLVFRAAPLWFALLASSALAAAPQFTATLDRDTIVAGESATLTLRFQGGQPQSVPALAVPNLRFIDHGWMQSMEMNNGDVSVSYSQTFEVVTSQPGDYTIPALTAVVEGQHLASPPLKLKVVKPDTTGAANGGEASLAFLKLFLPKKEVYLGEPVQVQLQFYVRDGVVNGDGLLAGFERLNGSPLKAEGFSVLKTGFTQRRQMPVGNASYTVATLVSAIVPVKTGSLTLDSFNTSITVELPASGSNRGRDPFDPFGMFQQVEQRRVGLAAETQTINVLPLPSANVPTNFTGVVGNFTISVTAGPTNVSVGDPITIKVRISGRGALGSLALPPQSWPDFKTYPPTSKIENSDTLGIEGAKTFEEIVVPERADIKTLPPVSFSFFNPDEKNYQTLSQSGIAVAVRPGGSVPAPTIAAQHPENQPGAPDIVSIKQRPGVVTRAGPALVTQGWFWGVQAVPVLALVASVTWRRRNDALANNPRLRRQRQVARILADGVRALRASASANNSEEFFATLFRLLQEAVGERIDLPASAITEAVVEERLRPAGVPDAAVASLHELFQMCNLARYAPVKSSQELAAIIPRFEAAVAALKRA
jgi:hypothetical protein